jgi:transposase InsO family protein
VKRLEEIGAVLSMSRPGRPWENGRCESFLKTLKQEEIDARPYRTMEELEQHLAEFIEQIYNRVRLHSALGYLSPEEFEHRRVQGESVPTWLPAGMSFRRHAEVPSPSVGSQA